MLHPIVNESIIVLISTILYYQCTVQYRTDGMLFLFFILGGALAIAIALHNIPEGICVAMPVYYATGSKLKAFFWSFLSGISEPLGKEETQFNVAYVFSTCTCMHGTCTCKCI